MTRRKATGSQAVFRRTMGEGYPSYALGLLVVLLYVPAVAVRALWRAAARALARRRRTYP